MPFFADGNMQQGFCGGVSEAGFGNTGGKQRGEESEAVALGAVYYTLWCGALFMIYLLG